MRRGECSAPHIKRGRALARPLLNYKLSKESCLAHRVAFRIRTVIQHRQCSQNGDGDVTDYDGEQFKIASGNLAGDSQTDNASGGEDDDNVKCSVFHKVDELVFF